MVCGHAEGPFGHFISLFNMPIFWIASGYFWNDKAAATVKSAKSYIWKKIKSLYFPYVIANCVFTILQNFFILIKVTDESLKKTASEILILIVKKFLFIGTTSDFGTATWFLRVLFLVSVGHLIVCFVSARVKWGKYIQGFFILAAAVTADVVSHFKLGLPFQLNAVPSAYLCYTLGIIFRRIHLERYLNHHKLLIMFCSFGFLCLLSLFGSVGMVSGQQTSVMFLIVCAFLGWVMLWEAASIVGSKVGPPLSYIGRHTMSILILHLLSFKLVTLIYCAIVDGNLNRLVEFPILHDVPYLWPFYTFAGVILPLSIGALFWKLKAQIKIGENT